MTRRIPDSTAITAISLIIIGILCCVFRAGMLNIIVTVIGVLLIAIGLYDVFVRKETALGIIAGVAGVVVIIFGWTIAEAALILTRDNLRDIYFRQKSRHRENGRRVRESGSRGEAARNDNFRDIAHRRVQGYGGRHDDSARNILYNRRRADARKINKKRRLTDIVLTGVANFNGKCYYVYGGRL